jgi:Beta-lactamase enzyme family
MTTPREAAKLMEPIATGNVVNRAPGNEMLAVLRKQEDRAMIPRLLPFDRDRMTVENLPGSPALRRLRELTNPSTGRRVE